MNVLLTGAFGNIGSHALHALLERGHTVRCFDIMTVANAAAAALAIRRYGPRIEIVWGDLRRADQVAVAVKDQDVVVHLAFVIPTLSATGTGSEERPEWAESINVGGTRNLIAAMQAAPTPPGLLFASSLHVYGRTQDQEPPRTAADPVEPIEHYARHKVACEQMVKASGLRWSIFRFAAALPVRLVMDPGMFDVPLNNRIEFVHPRDVGMAVAKGVDCHDIWGRTLLIGGGPRCRFFYRELVLQVLGTQGIGMLPESAFNAIPFATDWLDTSASQELLHYQQHTLTDYTDDLRRKLGFRRVLIALFRPWVRRMLLKQSPYYRKAQARKHNSRVKYPTRLGSQPEH